MEKNELQKYETIPQIVEVRRVERVPRGLLLARDKVYNKVQKDQIKYLMNVWI